MERNCRISGRVPVVMIRRRREREREREDREKVGGRERSKLVNCAANTVSTRYHPSPLPKPPEGRSHKITRDT